MITSPWLQASQTASGPSLAFHSRTAATARAWRQLAGGPALLEEHPELGKASPELGPEVERLVREWQGEVLDLVRSEGQDRRTNARIAAYGINGVGLFLMLVAFAHTGGALGGAEVGVASGASLLAQRVLEAIFGDQAVRTMAAKARSLLLEHVEQLYTAEALRYVEVVEAVVRRDDRRELDQAVRALVGR